MPSATNPVKGIGSDSPDNVDKFSQVVEKKIRNLEKRKTKIQALVDQKHNGKVLDADQVASVNSLPFVESNLEQLRELLPQFKTITNDYDKAKKKAARKEEAKRTESEFKRAKDILASLHYLSLFTVELKESLLTGLNGLTLTEDEIKTLDGFYGITDTTNSKFCELDQRLDSATSHLIAFLDRKGKEAVCGVNYDQIGALFDRLHEHHVFDPEYRPPVQEEPEPEPEPEPEQEIEDPEPEEEEEEPPVEEEEEEEAPESEVPAAEEALLNGETAPVPGEDEMVNFMHDSQLDRSESQLSPLAPEFQPNSGSGSPEPNDQEKATFGEFSQDDPDPAPAPTPPPEDTPSPDDDPAVMAWSAGPPAEEQEESANPWSKKSTLDWGNSSLPVEDPFTASPLWSTGEPSDQAVQAVQDTHDQASWAEQQPEMKDQTTQKVDEDGFTEVAERKRGSNRNKYSQRGTTPGSYRNNNNTGAGGRGGANPRYNSDRGRGGGSYSREAGARGGPRRGGASRGGYSGEGGARGGGASRGGYSGEGGARGGGASRGGYSGEGGARGGPRGGNYRGGSNFRGARGGSGPRGGTRPGSGARGGATTTPQPRPVVT